MTTSSSCTDIRQGAPTSTEGGAPSAYSILREAFEPDMLAALAMLELA
jgi:hypothetical protein